MKYIANILVTTILISLAGCNFIKLISGENVEIQLTDKEINDRLKDRFPINEQRFIFMLTFKEPSVYFESQNNKLGFKLSTSISIPGLVQLNGDMDITGKIRFNPETGEFFLNDASIKQLKIGKIPDNLFKPISSDVNNFVNNFFQKVPIYKLNEDNNKRDAIARMLLKSIDIKNDRLVITLCRKT